MEQNNPFGYPITDYLGVIGLAGLAGLIKYLNSPGELKFVKGFIAVITAGFTGVMCFWALKWAKIDGPLMALLIGTSGLMGYKAWKFFEQLLRLKLGIITSLSDSKSPPSLHLNVNVNTEQSDQPRKD